MSDPLVLRGVSRAYRSGEDTLQVLAGADLVLRLGEIVALVAPSGTGKSTLLHLAGLLERPDAGSVMVDGRDAGQLPEADRTAIRRDRIGFVYQAHHLLAEFTALENVVLPQMVAGVARQAARDRAMALLTAFGLPARAPANPAGQPEGTRVGLADHAAQPRRLCPRSCAPCRPSDHHVARLASGVDEHRNASQGHAQRGVPGLTELDRVGKTTAIQLFLFNLSVAV